MSKADLGRKVGLSRTAVAYYLRSMTTDLAAAAAQNVEVKRRRVLNHLDLVERVASTADEAREEIAKLRATKGVNPSVIFAGYRALTGIERLLAELLGDIQPPTQNTYVLQVAALLDQPVALSALSEPSRAVLEGEAAVAASR
jgi:AcrR family transcriptional regulator